MMCGLSSPPTLSFLLFFFNDTATTEIYTLSLHDALPICRDSGMEAGGDSRQDVSSHVLRRPASNARPRRSGLRLQDRKSTRLNSSHGYISYAVFCLKKKKQECNQN